MGKKLVNNGEFVKINQHNIHIYIRGNVDKPKIVFMSGSGTVAPVYDFKILYEKLVDEFRVIVMEKFGYGYSDIFETPCDIDTLVSIQKEALEAIGETGPYILAPHSMSGLEAIRWKQKYPSDVCAIIGLDMATPSTYKNWADKEVAKRIKTMKLLRRLMIHKIMKVGPLNGECFTSEEIEQHKLLRNRNAFNVCYINEANAVLKNADIVSQDGNIECPALLFSSNGKQTSKNWIEEQKRFASMMNAKLIRFDCGHYIHHYKSEEISDEIKEFINDLNCR